MAANGQGFALAGDYEDITTIGKQDSATAPVVRSAFQGAAFKRR
jgi:hypothetical protein